MRIGCGRLVAVLWTLLMKDTSLPGKHYEGRLFSNNYSALLQAYNKVASRSLSISTVTISVVETR